MCTPQHVIFGEERGLICFVRDEASKASAPTERPLRRLSSTGMGRSPDSS